MYLCKYLWSMFKMQDICKFTLDICIQISKNAIFVEIWKVELHWEVESTSDGGSRMRLRIVESGPKHRLTSWKWWNSTSIECFGLPGWSWPIGWIWVLSAGWKAFVEANQAIKCFTLLRQLGASAHLPAWVTQDLLSIRLSKLATHSNINFCLLTTSSVDGTTQ